MRQWLQLLPLFCTGFLVSRIFARTGLAERMLWRFLRRTGGRFPLVLLAVLGVSIGLSLFVPNVLTVLTLLPLLERLQHSLSAHPETQDDDLSTPMALALIYGANIGGMGSLIGSPSNALMLGALSFFSVPNADSVTFLSWLAWGIPLVLVFGLAAWGLLVLFLVPRHHFGRTLAFSLPRDTGPSRHQAFGALLSGCALVFWIVLSVLVSLFVEWRWLWDLLAFGGGLGFIFLVFGWSIREEDASSRPLLQWSDCYTGLPWRGLLFAGGALLVGGVLIVMKIPVWVASQTETLMASSGISAFWLYAGLTLITIFATELISNTAASAALFPIAAQLTSKLGWHPLPAMMGVALASTCAFMSPFATPATAIAFGGAKNISFPKMLGLGLLLNLCGGFWLAWWLTRAIPFFYGLSLT